MACETGDPKTVYEPCDPENPFDDVDYGGDTTEEEGPNRDKPPPEPNAPPGNEKEEDKEPEAPPEDEVEVEAEDDKPK